MPGEWSHFRKSTGSPALDGTKCGENKVITLILMFNVKTYKELIDSLVLKSQIWDTAMLK